MFGKLIGSGYSDHHVYKYLPGWCLVSWLVVDILTTLLISIYLVDVW
jgi:hypothetical protein